MDTKNYFYELWSEKANLSGFASAGRSDFDIKKHYLYINDIVRAFDGLDNDDIILDAAAGKGIISIHFAAHCQQVHMFDFIPEMVKNAEEELSSFKNISFYQDALPHLEETLRRKIKFTKIFIGGALQYLEDESEIRSLLRKLKTVIADQGKILCTHNPDSEKKQTHMNSYTKLEWEPERIEKALDVENKRLWTNFQQLQSMATSEGFAETSKMKISKNLFQSTHMYSALIKA